MGVFEYHLPGALLVKEGGRVAYHLESYIRGREKKPDFLYRQIIDTKKKENSKILKNIKKHKE